MVIKGNARGQAVKLALHLIRTDTNERMLVREFRGVVAESVVEALREMEAVASGARSRRPFYHASINTRDDEVMTDRQKARAIDRLEEELGLTGQPRVVVEHVKQGREHLHIAWCRIDGETMTAIPDNHNFRRHEIVARELEREFGHARVQGAHHEREGVERPARCSTHAEMQQAERSRITPEVSKARLRELWNASDSGRSFAAALEDAGWVLAQGDRRGFVALDPAGEVRAVNKDITGLTAARVRERLADIDADRLPSVEDARDRIRLRQRDMGSAAVAEPACELVRDDTVRETAAVQRSRAIEADKAAEELDLEASPQHRDAQPRRMEATGNAAAEPARAPQTRDHAANDIARALEALALTDPMRFAAAASLAREAVWRSPPSPSLPLEISRPLAAPSSPAPVRQPEQARAAEPARSLGLSLSFTVSGTAQQARGQHLDRPPPPVEKPGPVRELQRFRKPPAEPETGLRQKAVRMGRTMLTQLAGRLDKGMEGWMGRRQARSEGRQRERTEPTLDAAPAPKSSRAALALDGRQVHHRPGPSRTTQPAQSVGRAAPPRPVQRLVEHRPSKSADTRQQDEADRLSRIEAESRQRQADRLAQWQKRVGFENAMREIDQKARGMWDRYEDVGRQELQERDLGDANDRDRDHDGSRERGGPSF